MWKIKEGKVTWLSPWPDSSWRPILPSLGLEQLRGLVHPPALRDLACQLCRDWTDPGGHPKLPPSLIQISCTCLPINPSTSCLLDLPPQVRTNTNNPLWTKHGWCLQCSKFAGCVGKISTLKGTWEMSRPFGMFTKKTFITGEDIHTLYASNLITSPHVL